MIKVGIVGATGYTGYELTRLLARHPRAALETLVSRSHAGRPYSAVFPSLKGIVDQTCSDSDLLAVARRCDIVFLALPHGLAAEGVTREVLQLAKIIDLGPDFRLTDPASYRHWYDHASADEEIRGTAVYGLPEWRRAEITRASLIANPGCYATCAILSTLPLAKSGLLGSTPVLIDAKSGVSGAGRSPSLDAHYNECNETIKAYKVLSHRHTPEIEQELSAFAGRTIQTIFTPHLVPMSRGILVTIYAQLNSTTSTRDLQEIYNSFYESETFVRVFDRSLPETRWVKGSNYCDIAPAFDSRTGFAVVIGALDNLLKGAAGQAVQNMNIMFGLEESTGLTALAAFP